MMEQTVRAMLPTKQSLPSQQHLSHALAQVLNLYGSHDWYYNITGMIATQLVLGVCGPRSVLLG